MSVNRSTARAVATAELPHCCRPPMRSRQTDQWSSPRGGASIVGSTRHAWAEGAAAPTQLAQMQTGADGRFILNADGKGAIL
jgi:hypothetical protein